MDKIFFTHDLKIKRRFKKREDLSILKVTNDIFNQSKELILQSIEVFSKEIEWDNMWTLDDCKKRLDKGDILFLLLFKKTPIGHVWYDESNLFNAFVSKKRVDGDSVWFIQETMWIMKKINDLEHIKLWTDDWNKRAQRFWIKLGYKEVISNDRIL